MSIALVQAANGVSANSDPSTAFVSPVTVGNLLIALYDGAYHYAETLVILDTINGASWTPIFDYIDTTVGHHIAAWYCVALSSGADTVGVTGGHAIRGITVAEFSGVSVVDQSTSFVTSSTDLTSNPVTTAVANELFISFGAKSGGGWGSGSVTSPMTLLGSVVDAYSEHQAQMGYQIVAATQTGYTAQMANPEGYINANIQLTTFKIAAPTTYSISGTVLSGATVLYSGTASGSVIADGSGNYTIPGLAAGSYVVTPTKAGYSFSPTSSGTETITSSDITGVDFTATPVVGGSAYQSVPTFFM